MFLGTGLAITRGGAQAAPLDPATLSLTGFWRDFAYPWTGTASAGTSGSHNLGTGTAPTAGSLNGHATATFNGTTQFVADGVNTAEAYLTTTAYRVALLINPSAAPAPAANIFDNPGIVTENGGNWGIVYNSSGVSVYHQSTAIATAACGTGGWHKVDITFGSGTVSIQVDGGTAQTGASATTGVITGGIFRVGTNYSNLVKFTGSIADIIVASTALGGMTDADYRGYIAARYGQ